MYFQEASSASRESSSPIRKAVVIVVASTATHITPTLLAVTDRSMVKRKRFVRR